MSEKSAYVIVSLIGVAGLLLYFYLLVMCDISPESLKYTVIAASIGLLYPTLSLFDNEDLQFNGWKAVGVGVAGLCIVLISGFATKVQTSEGVIWDFLNAVTIKGWLYFYLVLLIIANICPLVLKKYSIWVSPFVIGIMTPVLLASLLLLAIIIGGLSLLGLFGKSDKTSSSLGSLFTSSPSTSNTNTTQERVQDNRKTVSTNIADNKSSNTNSEEEKRRKKEIDFLTTGWTHGTAHFKGRQPSSGMLIGGVNVWYNGTLTHTSDNGGVQIWEGTDDICVAYPRNYRGPKMEFYSSGGTVQIQVF